LVLKILPHAMSVQARDRADVLGTAALDEKGVGFYGYAFYDRIQRLAEGRRLSPTLLGHVLAHEIGHLLYDRFHARDVAPEQARTLFDVALGEFLFLAEPAKTVPNNHGGIIPLRRVEGLQVTLDRRSVMEKGYTRVPQSPMSYETPASQKASQLIERRILSRTCFVRRLVRQKKKATCRAAG
jgi:hypothetical protein